MKRLKRTFSEKFGRLSSSSDDNRIKITKDFDSEPIEYSNDLSPSTPENVEICECQGLRWDRNENTMILKKDLLRIEDAAHRSSSWSKSSTCPKCSVTKMTHANSFHGRKGTLGSLSENQTAETFAEGHIGKPRSKSESTTTPKRRYSSLSDPKSPFGKLDSYEFLELLGEGSYATVYKGKFKNSDQTVALKKVALNSEEGTPFTAIREVSLLKTLKHANIVTLYDIIHTNATLTLVFEYMYTDLSMYMEKCGASKGINPRNAVLFTFQLLRGLDFCHKKKILHRDLKPQNLLISETGELKLADFGLARAKSIPTNTYSNEVVTLWYRPPDVLLGSTDYTTSLDMWGVGCIFLEMLIGTPVCPGQTDACDQLCKIFELLGTPNPSTWPRLPDLAYYEEYFYSCFIIPRQRIQLSVLIPALVTLEYGEEFAYSLLQFEPSMRLSAEDAMKHPMCDLLPREVRLLSETDSIFTINQVKLSSEEHLSKPLMMIG